MLNVDGKIENAGPANYGPPLLRMGFRPFFLAAGIYAIISMALWMASYNFSVSIDFIGMSPLLWHAHEMLFGYTMAVVAGFLLTAVKNWTGIEVLRGWKLAFLLCLWLIPRLSLGGGLLLPLPWIAVLDISFMFLLVLACMRPVLLVKQYKQAGILSKLFLLMLCNLCFYLGLAGYIEHGVTWGLYSALYIIISLILVMLRRVMPMFVRNSIEGEVEPVNRAWVDNTSLVLLICLWISDVFTGQETITAILAASLTVIHSIRLAGWYSHQIWRIPLLWILLTAYLFIILGFALKALSIVAGISTFLSLHAFTAGGIGLVTLGMMSRVALGHTGRNVFAPPPVIFWSFATLLPGAIVRVIFPLLAEDLTLYWLGISQLLWMIAFAVFVFVYAPMLLQARVDGRDG